MVRQIEIVMDSDYRFEENPEDYPFWNLPRDEYNFNRLKAVLREDGQVWYEGSPLFKMEEFVRHAHSQDESYYNLFLTGETDESPEISYWHREPIVFNGHSITNTHISLYLIEESELAMEIL